MSLDDIDPEAIAKNIKTTEPQLLLKFKNGETIDWLKLSYTKKRQLAKQFPAFAAKLNKMANEIKRSFEQEEKHGTDRNGDKGHQKNNDKNPNRDR